MTNRSKNVLSWNDAENILTIRTQRDVDYQENGGKQNWKEFINSIYYGNEIDVSSCNDVYHYIIIRKFSYYIQRDSKVLYGVPVAYKKLLTEHESVTQKFYNL
jgi:hypothetical protein